LLILPHVPDIFIQVLTWIISLIYLFESFLMSLIILKSRLLNSLAFQTSQYIWTPLLESYELLKSYFFAFPIYCNVYCKVYH
jgi:hypothetical protein